MSDIVITLDTLIQPHPPRRAHPRHSTDSTTLTRDGPEDLAYAAIQAQIQHDVIDRAFFQQPGVAPLPPTPNGKATSPCQSCNYYETEPIPPFLPYAGEPHARVKTAWRSRRCQPAAWDLYDDEMLAAREVFFQKRRDESAAEDRVLEARAAASSDAASERRGWQLAEVAQARETCKLGAGNEVVPPANLGPPTVPVLPPKRRSVRSRRYSRVFRFAAKTAAMFLSRKSRRALPLPLKAQHLAQQIVNQTGARRG